MAQNKGSRARVLFLITKATQGGAQKYVYDLATGLPKNEFEPIVAYGTEGKLAHDLEAATVPRIRIPVLGRDIALLSDIQSFFRIRAAIHRVQPDVVHLNSSKAAALGALAARLAGVRKIIFTVHGWPFKEKRNFLWRAMVYLVSWFTALLSDETIVVSETDKKLAHFMIGVKRVSYIPLGLAPVRTLTPSDAFSKLFSGTRAPELASDTRRLLSIAELTPNKGIRYAIEAVSELARRGIRCIYVVAGEGEERHALEQLAREKGVSDRVYLLGFVENAAEYISGFDVFVLPSLKEGTSYSILEAATTGIPIVATTVIDASLKERFPRMRLVPPRDPYALADAIFEISRSPHANDALQPLSSIFDMVQQTIAFYRA